MQQIRSALIPIALALGSMAGAAPQAWAHDAQMTFDVGGFQRTVTVFVPDRLANSSHPLPAVIVLHGALQTGAIIRRQMHIDEVAERQGFVVAYPDGLRRGWNDGRIDQLRQRGAVGHADDVAFLKAVVAKLTRQGLVNPAHIYLTGVSNGGMMSFRMACDAPQLFDGIAPIIANLPSDIADTCRPRRPTPMLIINGTDDPLVPWQGGGVGFGGRRGAVLSTDETLAAWRRFNACSDQAVRSNVPHKDNGDPSRAEVVLYDHCRSGAPVALVRIKGGGHRIPGREDHPHPWIDRLLGFQNHDLETAQVVWDFFARPPGS
jgi:polyhydroxybutyrate depolymerase